MIDLFSNPLNVAKETEKMDSGPDSFGGEDFPSFTGEAVESVVTTINTGPKDLSAPLMTTEEQEAINKFYEANPQLKTNTGWEKAEEKPTHPIVWMAGSHQFYPEEAWIQTYSGRRFNPTKPYVDAIVIQDIAHALSMQCRFSGHVRKFYSVAQHSVLVSYICDSADALWGLMHDASEAYLVDVPRPLKRSGKFDAYLEFEANMQAAVCKRFGLPEKEPVSVKKADKVLLSTEARDLMGPLHKDWRQPTEPLPFKIVPLPPQEAKNLFMKRFFELTGCPDHYTHYLRYEEEAGI